MHSRSGSFRRANEKTALVKLISEGQVPDHMTSCDLKHQVMWFLHHQITRQDLQYLEILGHGNGGTVYRLETCWWFVRPGFKTGFFQNFPPAIQGDNGGEGDRIGRHTRRAETDYGRTGHPSQGVSYLPSLPPPPSSVLPPLHPLLLPFLAFPLSPSVTTIYHQCFLPFSLLLSPPLSPQCDSSYIIGFYGAFFAENRY